MAKVPNVCGQSFDAASEALRKEGFFVREKAIDPANEASSDGGLRFHDQAEAFRLKGSGAPDGSVVSQDPPAGVERSTKTIVDLTLAAGTFKATKAVKAPAETKAEKFKRVTAEKEAAKKATTDAKAHATAEAKAIKEDKAKIAAAEKYTK